MPVTLPLPTAHLSAGQPSSVPSSTTSVLAGAGPLSVVGSDVTVTLPDGRCVAYANLDIAASAPAVAAAADAVQAILPHYASVHRGAGLLSQHCTAAYERARAIVAAFVGCRETDAVVFTRNTTDALNLLARAVPADTTVLCFASEHHANLLPWRRRRCLPVPESPTDAVAAVERALASAAGPTMVSVTGASNVTGEIWPVPEIAAVARRYGARVAVDAAQLVAHQPVSLADLGADYIAFSGHKLYAPFGVGVLAGRSDWLDDAPPYLRGGGASAAVSAKDVSWHPGPARHEAGTPNLIGAVALAAVCEALAASDRSHLADTEQQLLARLRDGLGRLPGVVELGLFDPDHSRVGIVSFAASGMDSHLVARRLGEEYGIGVRDGLFCAHPLTRSLLQRWLGRAEQPTTAVRASLGLGTTVEHIDRLVDAVAEVVTSSAR